MLTDTIDVIGVVEVTDTAAAAVGNRFAAVELIVVFMVADDIVAVIVDAVVGNVSVGNLCFLHVLMLFCAPLHLCFCSTSL